MVFAFNLSIPLFVELVEIFGVLEHFIEKFLVAVLFAVVLAASHVLLESIESPSLFLALCIRLRPPIEVSVDQLPLIHQVAKCLLAIKIKGYLVSHVVLKHLLPNLLLKLIHFQAIQVDFGGSPL